MKNITSTCIRAIVFSSLLAMGGLTQAQTETTSTTTSTTSAGTVSEFTPAAITVRTQSSAAPISYTYSKTTTYVDENGNPVSMDVVRSGIPVTVYYTQDGGNMVASKVVVHKTVTTDTSAPVIEQKKTTTTTTSTSGQ